MKIQRSPGAARLARLLPLVAFLFLLPPFRGFATPAVILDRAQQRYPWSSLVDVDYTVSGATATDAEKLWVEVSFTKGTGADAVTVVASNFVGGVWCDLPVTNGTHHLVWDAAADGVTFAATSATAKVRLVERAVAEANADYAIIDLAAGSKASRYPIRFVDGGTNLFAAFNANLYFVRKLVMKRVRAGTFWMGTGNVASGTARHRVKLTKDYFLGLFPMSQYQYNLVTGGHWSQGKGELYPVNSMSWRDVMEGLRWDSSSSATPQPCCFTNLNNRVQTADGASVSGFRLPTEAEWEYACRAGTQTKFYMGVDTRPSDFWSVWGRYEGTSGGPMGTRKPNPWGFYEFYGNPGEWCWDWYGDYPAYSETEVTVDPTGCATGTTHVLRGADNTSNCSSGYRFNYVPTKKSYAELGGGYFGFRLTRTADTTAAANVETEVASATRAIALDLTSAAARNLADVSALLPLVYNSATDWTRGGDGDVLAALSFAQMSGGRTDDPATWVAGAEQSLASAAGEGTFVWTPPVRGLYRVSLTVGETVSLAYFDLTDTEGVSIGKSIESFPLTLSASSVAITGNAVAPSVTLKDGDKTLTEGVDYVVSCADNDDIGTATMTVTGIGVYTGQIVTHYEVVDVAAKTVASSALVGGAVDLRTNAVLKVRGRSHLLAAAANDDASWGVGGSASATACAVVSRVRLASADATPDEALRVTVAEVDGEGDVPLKLTKGFWQIKLSQQVGGKEASSLKRVVEYVPDGMMLFLR